MDEIDERRLKNIRSHIGQSIVRDLDSVSIKTDDALWLHTMASQHLGAGERIKQEMQADFREPYEVIGTSFDGVTILAPKERSKHFTQAQLRAAFKSLDMATVGGD